MSTGATHRVEGIDPATGDVLRLDVADTVRAIERLRTEHPEDLPLLAPGLVDLQVNGFAGHDVNGSDVGPGHIIQITEALARRGVTTWVPTVITASEEGITAALRAVAEARASSPLVADAVPFAHVEGPFLSDQDGPRGVHDREHLRPIDAAEVGRWCRAGPVGYVTLSPHEDSAPDQIARIVAGGTAVAIGHSHASPARIRAAADAGAELSTHLGNGIFAQLARHPNPIWEQLADDRLSCGFIADGHHLPGSTLRAMVRSIGTHRAFLVSDAVALAGSAPGRYRTPVGGEVELDTTGRLSYVGTELLAGAAADLAAGLVFAVSAGIGLPDALAMTTATPGGIVRRLGGRRTAGRIVLGAPADLVELDRSGRVVGVLRAGRRFG